MYGILSKTPDFTEKTSKPLNYLTVYIQNTNIIFPKKEFQNEKQKKAFIDCIDGGGGSFRSIGADRAKNRREIF